MNLTDQDGWDAVDNSGSGDFDSTSSEDGDEEDRNEMLDVQELEDKYPLDPLGVHAWNFLLRAVMNERVDENADHAIETGAMSEAAAEHFRNDAKINLDDLYQEVLEHHDEEVQTLPENCSERWAEEWRMHNLGSTLQQRTTKLEAGLASQELFNPADDWNRFPDDNAAPDGGAARRTIRDQIRALAPVQRVGFLKQMLEEGRIDEDDYQMLFSEFGW